MLFISTLINNIPENTSNGACMYMHTVIPYEIDKMA